MLIPQNRLLFWTAILLPVVAMAVLLPDMTGVALLATAALGITVLIDAVLGHAGVRHIQVSLPPVIRMSKGRSGNFPVVVKDERTDSRHIRVGLPLPVSVRSEKDILTVALPPGTTSSVFDWDCTPGKRGRFPLDCSYVEALSPLGFWASRGRRPANSELRVYPNLATDRKQLAAIFLNRGGFGMHTQRMIGQGRDFEKLREYIPGDSFDDIHWKATAKRGKPVTKLYQIERTQEIYVVVDASRLSGRQSGPEPALERFMNSALVLGLVAQQQGDLFGLITFSDKVKRFIRASGGKAHYNACRDALYTLMSDDTTPDFNELCSFIRLNLRRRALVMILTDLEDPVLAESFLQSVRLINRQHIILATMINQPGTEPLFTSPDAASVDSLYQKLGGHIRWRNLRELQRRLKHQGIDLNSVDNEKLSTELVSQYMSVKARQAL